MKTSERFTLNEYFTEYPDGMTYQEIIRRLRESINEWTLEGFTVWQPFENFLLAQIADFMETTREHFEEVTQGKVFT